MVRYIFLAKNKRGQSVFYGIGSIRKSIITRFRRITGDSRILQFQEQNNIQNQKK